VSLKNRIEKQLDKLNDFKSGIDDRYNSTQEILRNIATFIDELESINDELEEVMLEVEELEKNEK